MTSESCVECKRDITLGSRYFVNRLPSDDGYLCVECQLEQCEECGVETLSTEIVNDIALCEYCNK